ncbi:unnamed protein product [Onchocerca flexuosa]|uniref:Ovule protein n=1 Tax=Onchocerca flexuosa TaxID=387005 RepID=A0A183GZK0_9BILA|nr:unnamed protein product [Onchocerca flexuosa]
MGNLQVRIKIWPIFDWSLTMRRRALAMSIGKLKFLKTQKGVQEPEKAVNLKDEAFAVTHNHLITSSSLDDC